MSDGAAREAIRVERSPTRCPFCHSSVDPASAEWVACARCLGRHHAGCWSEAGSCAACAHDLPLSSAEARERPAGPVGPPLEVRVEPAPQEAAEARARSETLRVFDEHAAREGWWIDAVLGPLTLGIVPVLRAEQRLATHEASNDALPEPIPEEADPEVRRRVAQAKLVRLRSGPRRLLALGAIVGAFLAFAAVFASLSALDSSRIQYWEYRRLADAHLGLMLVCQYAALLAVLGHLHAVRESVRRHELAQWLVSLVSRGATVEQSRKALGGSTLGWNIRRVIDTFLSLGAFAPVIGLLVLPVAALRTSGALKLHLEHEAELDRIVPPRSRGASAKEAP